MVDITALSYNKEESLQNSDVFYHYLSDCRERQQQRTQFIRMDCKTGLLLLALCWTGEDAIKLFSKTYQFTAVTFFFFCLDRC